MDGTSIGADIEAFTGDGQSVCPAAYRGLPDNASVAGANGGYLIVPPHDQ